MQTRTFTMLLAMTVAVGCNRNNTNQQRAEPEILAPVESSEVPAQPNEAPVQPTQETPPLRITGVVLDLGLAEVCGVDAARAHFEYDSANLDAQALATVRQLAECLDDGPLAQLSLLVVGHADPRGPDDYNRELGMSRAASVADVLSRNGVPKDRIQVESAGEALAHDRPALWPLDRRVDIRVAGDD